MPPAWSREESFLALGLGFRVYGLGFASKFFCYMRREFPKRDPNIVPYGSQDKVPRIFGNSQIVQPQGLYRSGLHVLYIYAPEGL